MNFNSLLNEGLHLLNISLRSIDDTDSDYNLKTDEDDGPDIEDETPSTGTKKRNIRSNGNNTNLKKFDLDHCEIYTDISSSRKEIVIDEEARKISAIDGVLTNSAIIPGFEKLDLVPHVSKRKLKVERKNVHECTKGPRWFNMPAPEMTDEVKRDLEVLQMRSVLDPKHFYKKNDLKVLPKYFQIGRVLDSPADFYSSRIPKRQRKKTMFKELLADDHLKIYNKKRYIEISEARRKTEFKAQRNAKKHKQNRKSKK